LQEKDIDFYGRMRRKFDTRASALFASQSSTNATEVILSDPDLPDPIAYRTSAIVETLIHIDPEEISRILHGYKDDPAMISIHNKLEKSGSDTSATFSRTSDGLFYFRDHSGRRRLCIPKSKVHHLISDIHDSAIGVAHAGFERTYAKIASSYYWP
jgi:hypothetical protein